MSADEPLGREERRRLLEDYGRRLFEPGVAAKCLPQILWFVENEPRSDLAAKANCFVTRPEDAARVREVWRRHVRENPDDAWIHGKASMLFWIADRVFARSSLEKARALEPTNPKWAHSLAAFYALLQEWRLALEQYEALFELDPRQRANWLGEAGKAALESGNHALARRYAVEYLECPGGPAFEGDAVHDGHALLGRLALAEGDLERAKAELFEAGKTRGSAVLSSFGPDLTLASDLLARGERATVLAYLRDCQRFWRSEGLPPLVAAIDAGETPTLNRFAVLRSNSPEPREF